MDVKQLSGIRNVNTPTNVFRSDKYFGEFTKSVGWIQYKHPTLTNAEAYMEKLETAARNMKISEGMAKRFQANLQQYDPMRNLRHDEMGLPPFHLTTEERKITSNGKKLQLKF